MGFPVRATQAQLTFATPARVLTSSTKLPLARSYVEDVPGPPTSFTFLPRSNYAPRAITLTATKPAREASLVPPAPECDRAGKGALAR
jgi:hypothetical protein